MEGGDNERAARIKALLSSYYGGPAAAAPGEGAAPSGGHGDGGTNRAHDGAPAGPPRGGGGQPRSQSQVPTNSFLQGVVAGVSGRGAAAAAPPPYSGPAMDSAGFNADAHIASVLRSFSLEKLLTEHRNMAREIKNLDSDMQQLVYENYNKFISATDTIRAMKTNVDGMGSDMDKLKNIMDSVSDKSASVSAKLERRRDTMEELHKVSSLLKKLQTVFDLPKKMRAALEDDIMDTAVTFYSEAQPLLKKYGHRGTFRAIAAESDLVAKEISLVLKKRLTERKDDTEHIVLLLRKLGEPDESLQEKYLQGRRERVRRILREAAVVVDAMAFAADGEAVPADVLKKIEQPRSAWGFTGEGGTVAPGLRLFVKALDEKVINAIQETVVNVLNIFLAADNQDAAKRRPLVAVARELFHEFFRTVRRALADGWTAAVHRAARLREASDDATVLSMESGHTDFGPDWGADMMAYSLSTLSTDLGQLHGHLPELGLKERAVELVEQAVHQHLAACFGGLQSRVTNIIAVVKVKLSEGASAPGAAPAGSTAESSAQAHMLKRVHLVTAEVVQKGLASLLQGLRVYESHPRLLASWHDAFVDFLQGQLQLCFLSLLTAFVDATHTQYDGSDALHQALRSTTIQLSASSDTWPTSEHLVLVGGRPAAPGAHAATGGRSLASEAPKSGLVLLLAKLCTFMEQQTVPWVMETLANAFVGRGGGRGGDQPPAFVPSEVARQLNAASNGLLGFYVELHGRQLSLMVRRSVASTQWLHHREPRGPRPVCDLLVERLGRAEAEVTALIDDTGRRIEGVRTNAGKMFDHNAALETVNVERHMAKIFREKVKIFGAVQFTQADVLAAIIGVGLKSLVECIRLQTLGRAGLQQLQLDMHYLRPQLRRYTGTGTSSSRIVDTLLDEVVSAGVERATDPQLLEPTVLDRILTSIEGSN